MAGVIDGRPINLARAILVSTALALLATLAGATPALAEGRGWWKLDLHTAPTHLKNGEEGHLSAIATNVGNGTINAANSPIKLTDVLPTNEKAIAISATTGFGVPGKTAGVPLSCPEPKQVEEGAPLTCTYEGLLPPYVQLELLITVKVEAEPPAEAENRLKVEGGETPAKTLARPVSESSEATPFGIESFELSPEEEGGAPDEQGGSHPFQLATTVDLNQTLTTTTIHGVVPWSPAPLKDVRTVLPPGLVGATTSVKQCSDADFATVVGHQDTNLCRADTAVGVAVVTITEPKVLGYLTEAVPLFNLVPAAGEPARFGFLVESVPIVLDTALRTGEGYPVEVSVNDASETVAVLGSQVIIWGVPGDPRHDSSRGWECLASPRERLKSTNPCHFAEPHPSAYLTLPTVCGAGEATLLTDSWTEPGSQLFGGRANPNDPRWKQARAALPPLEGCGQLPFNPSIAVSSDEHVTNTPTGMTVEVSLPQESTLSATGLGEADVQATQVALPVGVAASGGAANGLETCSTENIGFGTAGDFGHFGAPEVTQTGNEHFSPEAAACPNAAKIGDVKIKTPLLAGELTSGEHGGVFLAFQNTNPFASPLVLYLIAEEPIAGVRIKLAGEVALDPNTGQLVSTFRNTPPEPFEKLTLHLFGGPRASQSTPPSCGGYQTKALFTPWSGSGAAERASNPETFNITAGAEGSPCPSGPLPFAPGFSAGSVNNQAAGFTTFTLTINHPDADQAMFGVKTVLPTGLAAMISSVTPCPEPSAGQEWSCGPESLVGHSISSSGLGGQPVTLGGQVYLTVGYGGAPFGLLVVTRAKAGPFDLGNVNVRSRIFVDPNTAAVTVVTDEQGAAYAGAYPLPTIIKGVPVQLKKLVVSIDREGFQFNPTNCNRLAITGTLTGAQGATAAVESPFEVANCAALPFKPTFIAETQAKTSKANGASLFVKVTSGPGQANIAKTSLILPVSLPSRLTTIQKACVDKVFEENPLSCPEGSNIGRAIIHTPVFKNPLSGPAYLVSHGSAKFPDVEFVLEGEGVKIVLDGATDIKHGQTFSRFETLPDAPFTVFETTLPEGPHSALAANGNLCTQSLVMPTKLTGQNGAVVEQNTKVKVTGCPKTKKLTRKQLLAKALKACKKKPKKSRHACEARARKKYGKAARKAEVRHHRR